MPLKCRKKVRYKFRKIRKGKQRLAFCNNKVVEVKTYYRNGKKVRHYKRRKPKKLKKKYVNISSLSRIGKRKYKRVTVLEPVIIGFK